MGLMMVALLALVLALVLVLGTVALRQFKRVQKARVRDALFALPDVSDADKQAAWADVERASAAHAKTFWYDLSAPVVMALVLPFVPYEANRLPRWFRKWDNNVSLNGDGYGWFGHDGRWHNGRDGVQAPPGTLYFGYSDPDYAGDAYYAPGHHPRSTWARYVWVGLRNRASQLSVDLGCEVSEYPQVLSGTREIGRGRPGHFLLRAGNHYHFKMVTRQQILGLDCAVIRSVGHKLEISMMRAKGWDKAAAVAIYWSAKRWKEAT